MSRACSGRAPCATWNTAPWSPIPSAPSLISTPSSTCPWKALRRRASRPSLPSARMAATRPGSCGSRITGSPRRSCARPIAAIWTISTSGRRTTAPEGRIPGARPRSWPGPSAERSAEERALDTAITKWADRLAKSWRSEEPGEIRIGSEAHKRLYCRMLLDTFNPYKPSVIDWPQLEPEARDRLVSLPIWDIAVQTEGKARLRVQSYADLIGDPLLKEAIELNAFEEGRHKHVLSNLVQAYGIKLEPEPAYIKPRDPEWAFMVTGFSECIDSFFAFGLFELAKRSGFFPPALVDTFEPVIQEEGRHILFFANWVAWHRRNIPLWRRPLFFAKVAGVWAFLIWERIKTARDVGGNAQDNNFTVTGSQSIGVDVDVAGLMDTCLAENDRRLSGYDPRLLRPRMVPRLVRLARRTFLRSKQRQG